jgi:hypothetical protein
MDASFKSGTSLRSFQGDVKLNEKFLSQNSVLQSPLFMVEIRLLYCKVSPCI